MVFASLSEKLQGAMQKLRGKGKISPRDVKAVMKEVKMALLEADVNFRVVKDFVARVEEKAVGEEVLSSLTPGQQVVKIVHQELTELMGRERAELQLTGEIPVIMLVGLQGAGKTTATAKLGKYLQKGGKRPLLVAADVYRPAAIDQLETLGQQTDLEVFSLGTKTSPRDICRGALSQARRDGMAPVIIDTAGRLHINEEMMAELADLKKDLKPAEILLVADAMTGQDAVNLAQSFNKDLGLTGVILTKMDGDARGGAALSIKAVTDASIKFVGVGEKADALEPFHPDRLASRILGMGDMMSLIEKAEKSYDQEQAAQMEKKMREASFTFDDFLEQLHQVREMGPLEDIIGMLPGMGNKKMLKKLQVDEKQLTYTEAIINSMTRKERQSPEIIDGSRRRRIASGSGTSTQEVNRLLKQFKEMKKMMKRFQKPGKKSMMKNPFPF